jgi:hypothetical protein
MVHYPCRPPTPVCHAPGVHRTVGRFLYHPNCTARGREAQPPARRVREHTPPPRPHAIP